MSVTNSDVKSVKRFLGVQYLPDRQIELMGKKIRPTVNVGGVKHYVGNYTVSEMKNSSFNSSDLVNHLQEEVDAQMLELVEVKYTFHRTFYPSIAEILSQIPKELKNQYGAFELKKINIKQLKNSCKDKCILEALDKGYFVFKTKFYRIKEK